MVSWVSLLRDLRKFCVQSPWTYIKGSIASGNKIIHSEITPINKETLEYVTALHNYFYHIDALYATLSEKYDSLGGDHYLALIEENASLKARLSELNDSLNRKARIIQSKEALLLLSSDVLLSYSTSITEITEDGKALTKCPYCYSIIELNTPIYKQIHSNTCTLGTLFKKLRENQ
jgi:hypothetical protein